MDQVQVVAAPVIDGASMTEDQVLALTQGIRVGIVRTLTTKAAITGGLPGDSEDRDALFKSLEGLDKSALTRKRIKADQEQATGVTHAVGLISQLLRQAKSNYGNTIDDATREIPVLGNQVPEPVLVQGELDQAPAQLDYDSFIRSTKGEAERAAA